jgi:hypothetical protein
LKKPFNPSSSFGVTAYAAKLQWNACPAFRLWAFAPSDRLGLLLVKL